MAAPGPVPALPDSERRTQYAIVASVGPLDVGFALYGDNVDYLNWIAVYLNGALTADYALSSPSGSLATIARPITDARITFNSAKTGTVQIVGARRPRRVAQFTENQGVSARDLNQALTDVVAMQREAWDLRARLIQGVPGDQFTPLTVAARKSTLLGFDGNGAIYPYAIGQSVALTSGATFNTRGLAQLANIAAGTQFVQTAGYGAVGDGGGAMYVPAGGSTAGGFQSADGQWWSITGREFDIRQFGAKCDGATFDDAAIADADSIATVAGVPLRFPGKTIAISGTLTPRANAHWIGAGERLTVIAPSSATLTAFNIVNDGVSIEEMGIVFSNTRTGASVTFEVNTTGPTKLRRIRVLFGGTNIRVGFSVTQVQATFDEITLSSTVANANEFDIYNAFIVSILNCIGNGNPAARPFAFMYVRNVSGQLQIINTNAFQQTLGVVLSPGSGQSVVLLKSLLSYYDSMSNRAWLINPTGTGNVLRCQSTMDWFSGAGTAGIDIQASGSAVAAGISFTDAHVLSNGNGLSATGVGVSYIQVQGGEYANNTFQGILFDSITSGTIIGAAVGAIGASGNGADGILISNTSDHCTVVGNTARGNLGTQIHNTSSGANHVIANNNTA